MPWQLCEMHRLSAVLRCPALEVCMSCPVDASLAAPIVHRKIPSGWWSCAGKRPKAQGWPREIPPLSGVCRETPKLLLHFGLERGLKVAHGATASHLASLLEL